MPDDLEDRQDRDYDDPEIARSPPTRPVIRERPQGTAALTVAVGAAVVLLLGAGIWYLRRTSAAAPEAAAPSSAGAPAAAAPPQPVVADARPPGLPALDASDAFVRELAARLSAHPQLAAWLVHDELVRRFVVTVDNLAEGRSPKPHLPFLVPSQPFRVQPSGDRLTVDPASYRRYDAAVEAFLSLDAAGTAELYRRIRPLLQQAYRELGYPDRSFDDALARALGRLLAVEVPDRTLEVVPAATVFAWSDPRLEAATAAEKHLLRLGPDNARRVQARLRELAAALGIQPTGEPAGPT